MYRILLLIVALITYASLYPWSFHYHPLTANPIWLLAHSWPARLERSLVRDVILNVLVYIPLGAAAFLAIARRHRVAASICFSILLGFLLSTSIELIQIFEPTRFSSALDVATNTLGACVGACLGWIIFPRYQAVRSRRHVAWRRSPAPFLLAAIWLGYELFPLFPHFGLMTLPQRLLDLARGPLSPLDLLASAVEALIVGLCLEVQFGQETRIPFVCFLLAVPVRLQLLGRTLSLNDLLGAAVGFGLWSVLPRLARPRYRIVTAAALAMLLVRGMAPFHFAPVRAPFSWRPFTVSMGNEWMESALVLLRKVFDYGSAVWLVHMTGARYRVAAVAVAALLAAIEVTQMWLPGRASESTDPIIAMMMGFILWRLEKDRR